MEFMSRGRSAPVSPAQPVAPSHGHGAPKQKTKLSSWLPRIALVLGVLLILVFVFLMAAKLSGKESSHINSNQYQAVFLTNNQVYFGKITQMNKSYLVLEDVFYVETPSTDTQTTASNANYTLRKLGTNELHSPEDKMVINREQVTFWENLKDDGQVVTKINEYKANPDAANQQSTTPSTQTPTAPSSEQTQPANP